MIPRFKATYSWNEIIRAVRYCTGRGERVEDLLKKKIKELYNVRFVFLFNHGRTALYHLIRAVEKRDFVVSPAYNCIAVPDAARYAGYRNVFVDVDLRTYNMELEHILSVPDLGSAIVIVTSQYGFPVNALDIWQEASRRGAIVIEDAAQALGAKFNNRLVGTCGEGAIISFQRTKVISSYSGGVLITNNEKVARNVEKNFCATGARSEVAALVDAAKMKIALSKLLYGLTFRILFRNRPVLDTGEPTEQMPKDFEISPSDFQKALMLLQLERLEGNLLSRKKIAAFYTDALHDLEEMVLPELPATSEPAWARYPVRVSDREAFFRYMTGRGVDLAWTYNYCSSCSYGNCQHDNSNLIARTVLNLPLYPGLSEAEFLKVAFLTREYFRKRKC